MKIYLVDGSVVIHRAFHALKGLTNSAGFPTGAIYGFVTMLQKLMTDKAPDAIAVAFDSPSPTFRRVAYEQYKAQRPPLPNDLAMQIPVIKELVLAFGIASFELEGYEADDIIGTLAVRFASDNHDIFIVSSDKDMMQLITERIKIFDPIKEIIIDESYVLSRYHVPVSKMIDLMALTGDASDNIAGVKGIGPKTAAKLLAEVGSVQALIDNPQRIKNARLQRLISENIDAIKLSKMLATVNCKLPLSVKIDDLIPAKPNDEVLAKIFKELEFKGLLRLLQPKTPQASSSSYSLITSKDELISVLASLQGLAPDSDDKVSQGNLFA